MDKGISLSFDQLYSLVKSIFLKGGLSSQHAAAVAQVITEAERDGGKSHGIYRIRGCLNTVKAGVVSPDVEPVVSSDNTSIIRTDAKGGFSCLAFERSVDLLANKAKEVGIAALAINNSCHFSALWFEVEQLAKREVAAIAICPSYSCVVPFGGSKPLFGTNPLAFAWPRPGKLPYVFDFATSVVARGEIELCKRDRKEIPVGWAVDKDGNPTTDPAAALSGAMLTFGGHKGSAVSTMIELLAAVMISDVTSKECIDGLGTTALSPVHGQLILAFSPSVFGGENTKTNFQRAESFFAEFASQGARLPSQRRFRSRKRAEEEGIRLSDEEYSSLCEMLGGEYD